MSATHIWTYNRFLIYDLPAAGKRQLSTTPCLDSLPRWSPLLNCPSIILITKLSKLVLQRDYSSPPESESPGIVVAKAPPQRVSNVVKSNGPKMTMPRPRQVNKVAPGPSHIRSFLLKTVLRRRLCHPNMLARYLRARSELRSCKVLVRGVSAERRQQKPAWLPEMAFVPELSLRNGMNLHAGQWVRLGVRRLWRLGNAAFSSFVLGWVFSIHSCIYTCLLFF